MTQTADTNHLSHLAPGCTVKDHFDRVDCLRNSYSWDKIFRVHRKDNPNETADNAHILASWCRQRVVLLFGTLEHEWELPLPVVHSLQAATGPRKGAASVFHEYMAAYQHDWVPAVFKEADYKQGCAPKRPVIGVGAAKVR